MPPPEKEDEKDVLDVGGCYEVHNKITDFLFAQDFLGLSDSDSQPLLRSMVEALSRHPTRKKPKRPSFTSIDEEVDEEAEELNKRADEVLAVVRRAPLPPASSDVERETISRTMTRKGGVVKGVSNSWVPSQTATLVDSDSDNHHSVPKRSTKASLPREDSATTLVSISTTSSSTKRSASYSAIKSKPEVVSTSDMTKRSVSASSVKLKPKPKPFVLPSSRRATHPKDSDSEPDPLDLFAS